MIEERIKQLEIERDNLLFNTPNEILYMRKVKNGKEVPYTTHTKIKVNYNRKIKTLQKHGVENFMDLMSPEQKEARRNKIKKSSNKEEVKQLKSNLRKEEWANNEIRNKRSKAIKKAWEDPTKYINHSTNIKKALSKGQIKISHNTLEYIQKAKINGLNENIIEKRFKTMMKNGKWAKSTDEKLVEAKLKQMNVNFITPYIKRIDWYFPDLDLYVELNGGYWHNYRPFNGSEEHIKEYNKLMQGKPQHKKIARKWKYIDPSKRRYCEENKLRLLSIYFDLDENFKDKEYKNKDEMVRKIIDMIMENETGVKFIFTP